MEERELLQNGWGTIGEESPLNRSPKNPTVMCRNAQGRYNRMEVQYNRPRHKCAHIEPQRYNR